MFRYVLASGLLSFSINGYASDCSDLLPRFQTKAKATLDIAKSMSENFATFRARMKTPTCQPSQFIDDGGERCSFICVFDNGEGAQIKMKLIHNNWRKVKGKSVETVELNSLTYHFGV